MDFPKATKEWAYAVASEIRKNRSNSADCLSQGLFNYLKGRYGYGVGEGLKQGKFIRWPHEIKKEWECIEAATATYAAAEALGLSPRMKRTKSWMGANTGHQTVDVKTNGSRTLIDPLNSMFGKVQYLPESITVEDNELTERCEMPISSLEELTRDEAIACIDYYRSDEGALALLEGGQQISVTTISSCFVHYNPSLGTFEWQVRRHPPFLYASYFSRKIFMTEQGMEKAEMEGGVYQSANWAELHGKEPLWRITDDSKVNDDSTLPGPHNWEFFPLQERGKNAVMAAGLYVTFLDQFYGLEKNPEISDGVYLFPNREGVVEDLFHQWEEETTKGITPLSKSRLLGLKRQYIDLTLLHLEQTDFMERTMDRARLMAFMNEQATQRSMTLSEVLRQACTNIGLLVDDIDPRLVAPPALFEYDQCKEELASIQSLLLRLQENGRI